MTDISLPSIRNARDLGGTFLKDGRKIRPRCMLRSAQLGEATETDMDVLRRDYRLSLILDLRTAREREERPDQSGGVPVLPCPILPDRQPGVTHERRPAERAMPDMASLYRKMMIDEPIVQGFRNALTAIISFDYENGSILWHCTEGKDRCGLTAALVLEAMGADREAIMADYLHTNVVNLPKAQAAYERLLPERGEEFAVGVYRALLADEEYLQAAWDAMGRDYLSRVLGFSARDIARFREAVTEG